MKPRSLSAGSRPVLSMYVAGVGLVSMVLLVRSLLLAGGTDMTLDLDRFVIWALAFTVADAMWFPTPGGKGTVSMVSTLHLAAIPILPVHEIALAAIISRLGVSLIIQRKAMVKALFNSAQILLAVVAAAGAAVLIAGPKGLAPDAQSINQLLFVLGGAMVSYYVVNTGLVCAFLALAEGEPIWRTWRKNFGYRAGMASSIALFFLAPAVTLAYFGVGVLGMAVFLLPIWFIRRNWLENLEFSRTNLALLETARFAAKGETAMTVGNELTSYTRFLFNSLRALEESGDKMSVQERQKRLQNLMVRIEQMANLSQGLMDHSHLKTHLGDTDISELIRETVDFIRYQPQFSEILVDTDLESGIRQIEADSNQIQLALLELLENAGESFSDESSDRKIISVSLRRCPMDKIALVVKDSGSGISPEVQEKMFDRGFSTKNGGSGFGLPTVKRVMVNHGGSVRVESDGSQGTRFEVVLPCKQEKPRRAA